ncbi:hypothetical protein QCN29_22245 [Streptomyces sp. HNM0663]|uniref:Uncharacterized protein n=1 Tax=Streptomyces chengmaiensis TaxID=3040919 RepID=A0ABT6HTS0_9ACTN|nr:hypothetical protein [Streptomyces chengmaiensis]MDH2391449.1 hypothetical protein [Streptomyces chengmaiensis]
MKTKRARVGLAIAGIAGLGLLFPAVALAQDDGQSAASESASAPASASASASDDRAEHRKDRRQQGKERREERQQELASALAKELGVSEDKVTAALEKIHGEKQQERKEDRQQRLSERLKKAVEEGTLTQEQADAVLEAAESGVLPGGHGGGPGHPRG